MGIIHYRWLSRNMVLYKVPVNTFFRPNSEDVQYMIANRTSKKVRRMQKGYSRMEGKQMGRADIESLFCLERNFRTLDDGRAKFYFGQPVHLFWASWFASAKEPPKRLGGTSGFRKPEWFESKIVSDRIKLPSGAMYAGHPVDGWGYKVF